MRRQFRFATERQSESSRLLAERSPGCKHERCRSGSNAVVVNLASGSDEREQPRRRPAVAGARHLGFVHLSSLVEHRSRPSLFEQAEVELEHDQLELRSRIAWVRERLAAGTALTLGFVRSGNAGSAISSCIASATGTLHSTAVPPSILADRPSRSHQKRTSRRDRRHLRLLRPPGQPQPRCPRSKEQCLVRRFDGTVVDGSLGYEMLAGGRP
jgi:hypothetical protein